MFFKLNVELNESGKKVFQHGTATTGIFVHDFFYLFRAFGKKVCNLAAYEYHACMPLYTTGVVC